MCYKMKLWTHINSSNLDYHSQKVDKDFLIIIIKPKIQKSLWDAIFIIFQNFPSQKGFFLNFYLGHC
jgi:hypothetical protein